MQTPGEYEADSSDQVHARDIMSPNVVTIAAEDAIGTVRQWLATQAEETLHQEFPVLDKQRILVGVVTQRDLRDPKISDNKKVADVLQSLPRFIYDDCTVRQAADHMVHHDIGRLPVVRRNGALEVIGIVTRSDILSVYRRRVAETRLQAPSLRLWRARKSG